MSRIARLDPNVTTAHAMPDCDFEEGKPQCPASTARMALKILGLYSEAEQVLGVSEIGRRLGLHKSKVSRLVSALVAEEFLRRTENGRYCLGSRLYSLGLCGPHDHAFISAARAELYDIRMATGENVHLAVLTGTSVVHIERVFANHLLKHMLTNPKASPAHATSTGKVLLAYAPRDICERVIALGLQRYTSQTVTDPEKLMRQLAAIRSDGYAVNRDEYCPGVASVAVPVFSKDGRTVAAMAVVAPTAHFTSRKIDDCLQVLKQSVARIARKSRLGIRSGMNNLSALPDSPAIIPFP